MKKLSLLIGATAMAAVSFAATPTWVEFSSKGPDKYADGEFVQDGEIYALVWVKAGAEFEGITADGKVVNAETSKLVAGARAKDRHCGTTFFTLAGEDAELASTGSFAVYLLDTRVRATADAEPTVGAVNTDGTVAAVNTYSEVAASVSAGSAANASAPVAGGAVATVLPGNVPQPVVTSIKVAGGKVIVTVADTVPYVQYGISSGDKLDNMEKNELVTGVNGSPDGDITLIVDDPAENRFFKVIRK